MRCCAPHGKITARPKFGVDIRKKMVYDTKANKEERSVLTCAFRTKQVNTFSSLMGKLRVVKRERVFVRAFNFF